VIYIKAIDKINNDNLLKIESKVISLKNKLEIKNKLSEKEKRIKILIDYIHSKLNFIKNTTKK